MNQPINLTHLITLFDHMTSHRIKYALGVKAPDLQMDSSKINVLDCSGFIQYCFAKCTDPPLIIPAGSWLQNDYFIANDFREVEYGDLHYADPSRLFISTIRAGRNGAPKIGHIWFTRQDHSHSIPQTMECYGGHGVGTRAWNTHVLMSQVFQTFEIPTV